MHLVCWPTGGCSEKGGGRWEIEIETSAVGRTTLIEVANVCGVGKTKCHC